MQSADLKLLKQFYQSLRDRPLSPDDPYYVDYLERSPERDPIAGLLVSIAWSQAASWYDVHPLITDALED